MANNAPMSTHSNLYVRNIPPSIDEDTILQIFSQHGQVLSCKLFNSPQNANKTAFCLLKYADVGQAQNAIDNLNGAQMGNSVLEVKFASNDAGQRDSSAHAVDNLYVKGLPMAVSEDQLRQIFSPYGSVVMCRVLHQGDPSQTHHQGAVALVRMGNVQEATHAMQALNEQRLPGCPTPLSVRYADGPEQKARKITRLQAGGASHMMAPMGYDMSTQQYGQSSNHGSSQYDGSMYGMHSTLPGHDQVGRNQHMVMNAQGPRAMSPSPASLYVKNLPTTADKLFLYEKFAPFGAVLSVKVLQDDIGGCKGIGFVNFADQSGAARAVATLHNTVVGDKLMHVAFQIPRMR